jgi:transcriptional regulator with XRE-family HTH domain
MDTLEKKIMNVIKQRAITLGLTQLEIARDLGVSLITVKRWYAGKGLKISNLEMLCEKLEVSINEVISLANEITVKTFSYTYTQEEALAGDPRLLALFDLLIGGVSLNQIKKKYKLEDKKLTALLLNLDKLKLIELHAHNKVKILTVGEPSWHPNGPLTKTFRLQMIKEFLGHHEKSSSLKFFIHDYLREDVEQIKKKIAELESLMLMANKRASLNPQEAKSFGTYLTFKEYEWDLRSVLEKN